MAFAGPKNRTGADGKDGIDGASGTRWLSGFGKPKDSVGAKDDFYFDLDTADIYQKADTVWVFFINLTGPAGKSGRNGKDGKDGKDGVTKVITSGSFRSADVGTSSFNVDSILTGYNSAGELSVLVNDLGNVLTDAED